MKYIVVLGDGMADEPLQELGGKTPLEVAEKEAMDRLAKTGELGMAYMVPEGMAAGSDTANLSVIGYNPKEYYTGRSPLEALSIGVDMKATDVSFRCNLVTLSEEESVYEEKRMLDHSSSEISTEDAAVLVETLKEGLQKDGYQFYVGTSYRHLLVWNHGKLVELTPPHDILTKQIKDYLPQEEVLREMMKKSYEILAQHPLNVERKKQGLNPANAAWFWGAGTRPALASFEEKTGKKGVMISAVDLLKGIAIGADMDIVLVEGATGGLHTNYEGKANAAVHALLHEGYDFAYIHVEAPDEMGHQGLVKEKIQAIEQIDKKVLRVVVEELEKAGEAYRVLVLPDHPTPIRVRTHTANPVPYLLYDSRKDSIKDSMKDTRKGLGKQESECEVEHKKYCEKSAQKTGIVWKDGYRLMEHLLEI